MSNINQRLNKIEAALQPGKEKFHIIIKDDRIGPTPPLLIDGEIITLNGRTPADAIQDYAKAKGFLIKESNCLEICLSDFKDA